MSEQGKVKWFSNVKGFGFLEKEGAEKDIFVHYTSVLSDGYRRLKSGEEVTFEVVEGAKGPQAKNVIRVKKPPTKKAEAPAEAKPAPKESTEKAAEESPAAEAGKAAPADSATSEEKPAS